MSARIFLPLVPTVGETLPLAPALSHYLVTVLRLGPGDAFRAFDPEGAEYGLRLDAARSPGATAKVLERLREAPAQPLWISLGQGLPKASKMDLILRQGTEMGVNQFIPLMTERSVSRPEEGRWDHKRERWQKILVEACRQCGRRDVPRLDPLLSWEEALGSFGSHDLVLMPYEREAPPLRGVLESHPGCRRLLVLIGPEGGWSPKEVEQAQVRGALAVHLPVPILRTETAGLAVAAMIRFFMNDRP